MIGNENGHARTTMTTAISVVIAAAATILPYLAAIIIGLEGHL